MTYKLVYDSKAKKELNKLDKHQQVILVKWIDTHLNGCENPREHGKSLNGSLSSYWRYRVGQYRIVAKIEDDVLTIVLVKVGHRREVYK